MYVSLCIRTQYYARTIYVMPDWQYIYCRFMYMSKQTTTIKRLNDYIYVYVYIYIIYMLHVYVRTYTHSSCTRGCAYGFKIHVDARMLSRRVDASSSHCAYVWSSAQTQVDVRLC